MGRRVEPVAQALRSGVSEEAFFARLPAAPSRVLLLDFDGTLAPFRLDREGVRPYPDVMDRVAAIREAPRSRVVVISGRSVASLRPLLGLDPAPELRGTHGWERWTAGGGLEQVDPGPKAARALEIGADAVSVPQLDGRVERKPVSVAVHLRGMGERDREAWLGEIEDRWGPLRGAGLEIHPFDGGLELRVEGRDKGSAVREVLEAEPSGAVAAYLGDDLTDEDAFRAVRESGGLAVLVRGELRETEADLWIEPPSGLEGFLDRWLGALQGNDVEGRTELGGGT
jgi:trehalose 6-phosphate phosphatase